MAIATSPISPVILSNCWMIWSGVEIAEIVRCVSVGDAGGVRRRVASHFVDTRPAACPGSALAVIM